MTIGFCVQICIGAASDPTAGPQFIALSVSVTYIKVIFHTAHYYAMPFSPAIKIVLIIFRKDNLVV